MPNFNFPGQTELYQEPIFSVAEFASRWKRAFSPESVARGKTTAETMAKNKKGIQTPITSWTADRYKEGIPKSQELAAKGKQAMLTKAASPNRTMRPTTQRGGLKVARSGNKQLTPKSAQSFKQGAQNQATNKANAVTARLQDRADKLTGQGKYKTPLTTPTLNPFEQSSWEKNANKGINMKPKDVSGELGSISTKKPGLLSRVGGAIRRNPVAAGAGLGAVGAGIGYGIYKNRKQNKYK